MVARAPRRKRARAGRRDSPRWHHVRNAQAHRRPEMRSVTSARAADLRHRDPAPRACSCRSMECPADSRPEVPRKDIQAGQIQLLRLILCARERDESDDPTFVLGYVGRALRLCQKRRPHGGATFTFVIDDDAVIPGPGSLVDLSDLAGVSGLRPADVELRSTRRIVHCAECSYRGRRTPSLTTRLAGVHREIGVCASRRKPLENILIVPPRTAT